MKPFCFVLDSKWMPIEQRQTLYKKLQKIFRIKKNEQNLNWAI